nr:hypothetical protein [uncultured Roseovarius sp.]
MDFITPNRKARLAQLGFLLRHTFTIIGRNGALLVPLIRMWIYAALMVMMFFAGLFLIFYENGNSTWFLVAGVVMFVYKFIFYNRTELTLSRLIYGTATGATPTRAEARREIAPLKSQVRILALLDMASAWVASRKKKEGGLMSMLLGALVEVWDLANHFLLPAIAIDKLGLRDGVAEMKRLKDHVPETLAGVFGIDIMGGVVGTLMAPLYAIGGLAGVACGLLFGAHLPHEFSAGILADLFPTMPEIGPIGPETVFNWLPVFVVVALGMLLQALMARTVTAIKVVYFTLFYIRIKHADALAPEIRADLEGYLDMNERDISDRPAPA